MTWKAVGALTSAMILTVGLVISALIWSGQGVHGAQEELTQTSPLLVQTKVGKVIGSRQSKDGYRFVAYKSIPFAKPPVGELRFQRPQALDGSATLNETINSVDYKKSCWSATKKSTSQYYGEDCLYLNVYVPDGEPGLLPVMVWIHGGGFVAGSTFPEPSKLVDQGRVIVVTVNYRLSIFGFITTLDDALPSNNGLWDQYMAIRWVHDNIQSFRGDADSITVFGESAGAISVGLHVVSPYTSRYFQKAVLQSGAMTSGLARNPKQAAAEFATLIGCPTSSQAELSVCVKKASVADILKYSRPEYYVSSPVKQQFDFVWVPVVDGDFIPDEPLRLLHNVTFLKKNAAFDKHYLIGVLNDEGGLLTTNFYRPIPLSDLSNFSFFSDVASGTFLNRYGPGVSFTPAINKAIHTFYAGGNVSSTPPSPISVLELASDAIFVAPATEAALALTSQGNSSSGNLKAKTFFYHFDFCPASDDSQAPCFTHGSEVALEFPKGNISDPVRAKLSDMFISLLSKFAANSDPGAAVSCGWPEFEPQGMKYLRISPSPDVRRHLYNNRVLFWLKTIPSLIGQTSART